MRGDQRDKIAVRLNRKATRSKTFKDMGGRFLKIKEKISVKPKYGLFKGTDTFSWKLETTGASQTSFQEVEFKTGKINFTSLLFPTLFPLTSIWPS